MNYKNDNKKGSFPDPLASTETKNSKAYGIAYAKAMESQWGKMTSSTSLYGKRNVVFERSRDYANGNQDTNIYKKLLRSLNPNDGDGSFVRHFFFKHQTAYDIRAVDMDGDYDLDLLIAGHASKNVFWFENPLP